ncbi:MULTISPECIES: glycosyltransferase family 4 protein [unclassified Streptomyces]|uniref:glycosyltransferase family 4 protein n=1 Tax=unclassified Streptomyces TaxID=2593676 RepID=UPI000DBA228F|nr:MULTISPECIES: glycosyltransferase family 4 protein [unclassified Streptomyces]MYT74032.1 glycosyltransferase [Streptomyces sp. SID8367]RAJ89448.1 glycosyl transferase family 1 [Streptomyces sp. PsTaAH-137]
MTAPKTAKKPPRIRYLLMHAYGRGGTIRTVFNQANSLVAAGWDVEIVCALRNRDDLQFPLDERVPVTTLLDVREGHRPEPQAPARGFAARVRRALRGRPADLDGPGTEIPAGEFGARYFTRRVELALAGYLRSLTDGVLVTTRPALNFLSAAHAVNGVVRVAQEHMNHGTHKPDVQQRIVETYGAFAAVAVLTERDRAEYARLLPGTRVVRIPNAVHSLDQVPSGHAARIVVAAGRLFPQKGFDLLIPAWAKLVEAYPDWQLRIYGTGEKKAQLRALIEEHHLYNHVFLMGHSERLDDELAKASVYVLSSRFEGLPMVMIEAMAHALPVVSFDCPTGPSDVLTHGVDGLLVPEQDPDALADALSRLMADRELRTEMGTAALLTAAAYGPDAVHPRWEALFSELTGAG